MTMQTLLEKERRIPIVRHVDVLVAGGGPAGLAAGIASARAGARTLIVEKNGWLGGMATSGLVHPFMPSYAGDRPVNAGIFAEVVERLVTLDAAVHPATTRMDTGYTGFVVWPHASVTPFDVEMLKWVILDLIQEANVDLLLHAWVVSAFGEKGRAEGLVIESKSGRMAITADVVVDATGDGDVAHMLGAPCAKGSDDGGLMQPATLFFRLAGVNREAVDRYIAAHPEERHFKTLAQQAKEAGEFIPSKHDVLFFYTPRPDEVAVNTTRIHGVDGTSVFDRTRAEIETRRQVRTLTQFFRKYVPGFERSYLSVTAQEVGFRETRRIVGEYVLTKEDVLEVRQFPDNIAQCAYMIDIHDRTGTQLFYVPVPEGKSYGVPYRCLLPQHVDNLLVAGRCVSATQDAQGSLRVMPPSFSLGQAAGTAAALAVARGVTPRDVDREDLREALVKQGQVVDGRG
jgi:hypothetical protein